MSQSVPSVETYAAHLESRGRLVRVGGEPWMLANRRLTPAVPPHRMGPVDRAEVRRALRQSGAIAALWTDAWDTSPGPWWWVCCDDPQYDYASLRSSRRSSVRKGLRLCEVRRIGVDELVTIGYGVYKAAFARYGTGVVPVSCDAYIADVRRNAEYVGRETWGAFIGGALAAYATCIVIDDFVLVSAAKADPSRFKSNPNEAVWFELTRHYLRERGIAWVADGARVLQHQTNIQGFIETMGYRRVYCPLRLEMLPGVAAALRLGARRWARMVGMARWRPALLDRIEALDTAYGIARVCAAEFP
ncbi:MAG TPA: hypothetical protein PLP01_03170 [Phycisphaerae bacterium]|mgnify:CR=1 FL=1|nr:hypothetical protein [Phycisphaerae bacterium]